MRRLNRPINRPLQPLHNRCEFTTRLLLNSSADRGARTQFQAMRQPFLHRNGAKNDGGNSPLQPLLARHHIEIERDSRVT
jgi:hypothetical protein